MVGDDLGDHWNDEVVGKIAERNVCGDMKHSQNSGAIIAQV